MKEEHKDYELDGLEHIDMTPKEIENHRFTRRVINKLEISALISISLIGISYGIYNSLPSQAQETLQNLPSQTYWVCSELYQYISQVLT